MGRPRKIDALTSNVSGRIRPEQDYWLRWVAGRRFDGEFSRTLRWAIDQAQAFDVILRDDDPVRALDEMLHPPDYHSQSPEEVEEDIREAEREDEAWRREQAIKRAQRRAKKTP
ncbi:MAG TPA: hypothetical protein VMT74_12270 [Gaiellaceae bacterium]|nr:hypothetical protein [Gaiellaceae bacterium]